MFIPTPITYFLTFLVLLGAIPVFAGFYQFLVAGLHGIKNHYDTVKNYLPRIAVIIPAWNEGDVIGKTIEHLMSGNYPLNALRLYVVDDASADSTSQVIKQKGEIYANNILHLRRERGGEGKAQALNHGINIILKDDWAEAILIIDADVLFEKNALRYMTRHLADKKIGSVTAYIKEGSNPANFISRFIAFEYITAQAVSRRAQNVMGHLACVAGGAQLHTRENLEAIGGIIDTSSLAEDTFTTFKTQLNGHRVVFDGNAKVWAEEPGSIASLWKQRLRWARGNLQITKAFKHVWLNKKKGGKLGSISFSFLWFAILLTPVYMILGSIGLLSLYFINFSYSWLLFRDLWMINTIAYFFITLFSFIIDSQTAGKAWLQGILFPGIPSLLLIIFSCFPGSFEKLLHFETVIKSGNISIGLSIAVLSMYAWLSLCMLFAFIAYLLDKKKKPYWLSLTFLLIAGFGSLLCTVTLYSYIMEFIKAEIKWDKTEKSGKVAIAV